MTNNTTITGVEPTQNLNVIGTKALMSPRELKMLLPMTITCNRTVIEGRQAVKNALEGNHTPFLVIVGPCSIHDVDAAAAYAERLVKLRQQYKDRMEIIMRVYFEKPRTTVGWKGLINDPDLDDSFDMERGLKMARQLLIDINQMGLPAGTEMLEPITPQYIADLISWASIGARTIESQTHRQLASGLSMPVGYKNATDGNLQIAIDGMRSALASHHFLGIDEDGRTCVVATTGNKAGHVILRGGSGRPNYDPQNVAESAAKLKDAGLPQKLVIDCSHANSGKKHEQQENVWKNVIEQRASGNDVIVGAMLESNINPGNQKLTSDKSQLKYGVSVTDACIGWEKTEELLAWGYEQLG